MPPTHQRFKKVFDFHFIRFSIRFFFFQSSNVVHLMVFVLLMMLDHNTGEKQKGKRTGVFFLSQLRDLFSFFSLSLSGAFHGFFS